MDYSSTLLDSVKGSVKKHYDSNTPRGHLGCSEIGKECRAELWHSFRWNTTGEFDADTHLRFQDGHRSEDVMAEYIRRAGINLKTEFGGDQMRITMLGGHFAGSLDGMIFGGLPWHKSKDERTVWEHKAVNDTKFKKLKELVAKYKDQAVDYALMQWDEVYYAQAQMYMLETKTESHWLTCSTAGCRDFTGVVTKLDRNFAEALKYKAESIITADVCPDPAFSDPSFYKAKFLNARDLIYFGAMPAPNYRNSMLCSPVVDDSSDAIWHDCYLESSIHLSLQDKCPDHHLWIPSLVPYARCVSMENSLHPRYTVYELEDGTKFYNCQKGMETIGAYNSEEMRFLTPDLIRDPNVEAIRQTFNAKVSG